MKISKLFCIDADLFENLQKVDNASKLVNDLLKDYFSFSSENASISAQKQAEIKSIQSKLRKIKQEKRLISQLESYSFDQMCINWVYGRAFIYSDDDISAYKRNRRKTITVEEFKKCAEIVQKNGHLFKKTA